jgi:hypothetical protein
MLALATPLGELVHSNFVCPLLKAQEAGHGRSSRGALRKPRNRGAGGSYRAASSASTPASNVRPHADPTIREVPRRILCAAVPASRPRAQLTSSRVDVEAYPLFQPAPVRVRTRDWFDPAAGLAVNARCLCDSFVPAVDRRIDAWLLRFYPTCSDYAILSIRKRGFARGMARSVGRVRRCRAPNGGVDSAYVGGSSRQAGPCGQSTETCAA